MNTLEGRHAQRDVTDAPALSPFVAASLRGELVWTQPRVMRRVWRLESGGRTYATLVERSAFGHRSTIRFADGSWTLKRLWTGGIHITSESGGEPVMRFHRRWAGGGRIERGSLDELSWVRTGFAANRWGIRTSDQLPLVRFRIRREWFRNGANVEFEDAALRLPDLQLLVALGWFLVLHRTRGHGH